MTQARRSRRRVLTAGVAAGTLLTAGPLTLAGCVVPAPTAPAEPDPLESPARRAEADVALARAVAGAHAGLAAAAGALATDRQEHATALRAELRRVAETPAAGSSVPPTAPPSAPPVTAAVDQAEARDALAAAVRAAQEEATRLVGVLPGYRAALLASVAACCATHAVVLP